MADLPASSRCQTMLAALSAVCFTLLCASASSSDLSTCDTNCTCCIDNLCSDGSLCDRGCKHGFYGSGCTEKCPEQCFTCHRFFDTNRACAICNSGFYGGSCQLNCSPGCKNSLCHKNTGDCTGGCAGGFTGDKCCVTAGPCSKCSSTTQCRVCKVSFSGKNCASCKVGFYGNSCNITCPENCNMSKCDRLSGECTAGCIGDFASEKCNRCKDGFWSKLCNQQCPQNCIDNVCRRNGACSRCIPGQYGTQCTKQCPDNCYDCDQTTGNCNSHCNGNFSGDMCGECIPGNYGEFCTESCPRHCKSSKCKKRKGDCIDGCKNSFSGDKCCIQNGRCRTCSSQSSCSQCEIGYYGSSCQNRCPQNCKKEASSICGRETGNCISGCKHSFSGDKCCIQNGHCLTCSSESSCSQCEKGYYGITCSDLCPSRCFGGVCDRHTGICSQGCKRGASGDRCCLTRGYCNVCKNNGECSECKIGYYGDLCNDRCPRRCRNNVCEKSNGTCSSGCDADYSGDRCCVRGHCKECLSDSSCAVCKDGYYRPSCTLPCSTGCAANNCHMNGSCVHGCQRDYTGNMCCLQHGYCNECSSRSKCKRCSDGYYGNSCNNVCSSGCKNKRCDKRDGKCSKGCQKGITGDKCCQKNGFCITCKSNTECSVCQNGYFGLACNQRCSTGCGNKCNRKSSKCSCKSGYSGDKCCVKNNNCKTCSSTTQCSKCILGYHGKACGRACPNNCENSQCDKEQGTCSACKSGYYGNSCNTQCPNKCLHNICNMNGTCTSCKHGYYGSECTTPCPSNCLHPKCNMNGTCNSCQAGFYGQMCQQACHKNCIDCSSETECGLCKPGFYGSDCRSSCSRNCVNCTSDTNCGSCKPGYHGNTCQEECSLCKPGTSCRQTDGYCLYGCKDGYSSWNCSQKCGSKCTSCLRYHKYLCTKCAVGRYSVYWTSWNNEESSFCQANCSQNCLNGLCDERKGNCFNCTNGFHGDFCKCPIKCEHCETIGQCSSCKKPFANHARACECRTDMCVENRSVRKCPRCVNSTWFPDTDLLACCPCSNRCKNRRCDGEDSCSQGCEDGYFGPACDKKCSRRLDRCVLCQLIHNNFSCEKCQIGFYPDIARCRSCSQHCINGTCDSYSGKCLDGCTDGYWGEKCDGNCGPYCENCRNGDECLRCEVGRYMINCSGKCSPYCAKTNGKSLCNITDGSCLSGCINNSLHGKQCRQDCSRNCTNSECDWLTGRCAMGCLSDLYGDFCNNSCSDTCEPVVERSKCHDTNGTCVSGCLIGYYGDRCEEKCNSNCINGTCDRSTGMCVLGCVSGFSGPNCSEMLASAVPEDSSPAGLVAAIVAVCLFVLLGFVAAVAVRYTRKRSTTVTNDRNLSRDTAEDSNREHVPLASLDNGAFADEAVYANAGGLPNTRIATSTLAEYVTNMTIETCKDHFQMFPKGLTKPHLESLKPKNATRNRYKSIYPYDHCRVKLAEGDNDYINASYIDGFSKRREYIASLGPLSKTTERFVIFWQMIWQEKVEKIVMLTNLQEPSGMKCEKYWPDLGTSTDYADVSVFCRHEDVYGDYIARSLLVTKRGETRLLYHLHFTSWPDKSIPGDATSLLGFRHKVSSLQSTLDGPTVVHCSAGIGRTGTYIALDHLSRQSDSEDAVDIFRCVAVMREQRVGMVQTWIVEQANPFWSPLIQVCTVSKGLTCNSVQEQYMFLHRAVAIYVALGCQPIRGECFSEYLAVLDDSRLQNIFSNLEICRNLIELETTAIARNKAYLHKNRACADIPGDRYRTRLHLERTAGDSDYINAVFFNDSIETSRYIVAQTPVSGGEEDFLTLLLQEKCSVAVDLDPVTSLDDNCQTYLTENNKRSRVTRIQVSCKNVATSAKFTQRQLSISMGGQSAGNQLSLSHYQFTDWGAEAAVPDSPEDFVGFIRGVEAVARKSPVKGPVLLHCGTAGGRSCLFYVVSMAIQKLETEHEVSVVSTVQQARTRRRLAIPNKEQLLFCYQCVDAYLQTFETYSNFVA